MELFALVLAIATLASAAADPAVNSGGLTPDLAKWLSQRESPAKISAKIAQDVVPGMGFGLKAEEAVVANETLMEVPASALLSMKTASEGKLKGVVEELLRSNCSANSVLALHLLHERSLGESSAFHPYIESLPRTFDLPLAWSAEELEELNGTQLLPRVLQQKQAIRAEYEQVVLPVVTAPGQADLAAELDLAKKEVYTTALRLKEELDGESGGEAKD